MLALFFRNKIPAPDGKISSVDIALLGAREGAFALTDEAALNLEWRRHEATKRQDRIIEKQRLRVPGRPSML